MWMAKLKRLQAQAAADPALRAGPRLFLNHPRFVRSRRSEQKQESARTNHWSRPSALARAARARPSSATAD